MSAGSSLNGVLWQLARPDTDGDRKRARLVAAGVAGSGMFLLAAVAILAVKGDSDARSMCDEHGCSPVPAKSSAALLSLAPYLSQSGLRGGTAFGAALLVIPFVLFGLQALRTGTAARERRLAALSLAGATRPQLRRLAVLEGTRAAVIGSLLSGPGYLGLWLIFGWALPYGAKMLPRPGLLVIAAWPVLVVLLGIAGGCAAGWAARPATVSPLGMTRRVPRKLSSGAGIVPVVAALVILVGGVAVVNSSGSSDGWLLLMLIAAIAFAITGGPWLILLTGRIAVRRGLVTSLAGRRLLADVRSPGRIVGVLLATGIAFGVIAAEVGDLLATESDGQSYGDSLSFYLAGFGAAAIGGLVAAVVASSSLTVGATEQVLDGRRGAAVLVALAASPSFICEVVRRQLLLAAVPAAVIGAPLGWAATGAGGVLSPGWIRGTGLLSLVIAVLISGLAAALGALAAARAVRPAILASSTADNLRTA